MNYAIHFTSSFTRLKSILKSSSLRLHYCKEDFCLGSKRLSRAVHPMISFSRYNISTLKKKIITYGEYGIAFNKSWIDKHKIHEVLYINRNSLLAQALGDLLIARRKHAVTKLAPRVRLSIMNIKCFTKNATGYNSYLKQKDFNFRIENEWRYVPTKKQIDGKLISISRTKYLSKQLYYNNQLKDYSLNFTERDIAFIFVKTKNQTAEVLTSIKIQKEKIKISDWKKKYKN